MKLSDDSKAERDAIQKELERISVTVETLQLWAEKMLLSGQIDPERYKARKQELK